MELFEWVSGPQTAKLPVDYQDIYRRALETQWHTDLACIRLNGIAPPWQSEPAELPQHIARLLTAVADNGGLQWHDTDFIVRAYLTNDIGLQNIPNAKQTINEAHALGFISIPLIDNVKTIMLTCAGISALEADEDLRE
jgi:hypothetical protein